MAATVTVACKLPNGLILRVFDMVDRDVPVLGGGVKTEKVAMLKADPVEIKGSATPFGMPPAVQIEGGYALTTGVNADFFALWLEQNKDSDLVKNNLIFALDRQDSAAKKAQEQASIRSGLEPVDPSKPGAGIASFNSKAA